MEFARFAHAGGTGIGALVGDGVVPLRGAASLAELLRLPAARSREVLLTAAGSGDGLPLADVRLLPPVEGRMEVWGAGVTYERSRDAREEESAGATCYDAVYAAERPELFLKAAAWRVRADGVGAVRPDATDSVPEPELALVLSSAGEVVGLTLCDDLTARSIEGQNPLYLPQAKVYRGSCVLSPVVVTPDAVEGPVPIRLAVHRDGQVVLGGETDTGQLHRTLEELADWLFRHQDFPDGAVLTTGTGVVPPLGEGLRPGDVVEIDGGPLGVLRHRVAGADELSLEDDEEEAR
ncbi:2-dehydro-3-deoxy-D-arabinonate dehydratase [Motilibacter rhizosphaerae]|uniref:2-dehydro-3-deoxy-D-arabinonate dehydratase n=1 Tax=Motilibacter rhizosphaerae TaxID=598652 RepID=A0A4V2F2T7_9ACTN|nr:fumarylacetoacetate hydrolase family protein [Motilibacter rhizosphaerae]RZS80034.1 2-dehydro-3-deoxy-D-arabinonate dehydratase [Motilibacter rhizosphaerae]